MKPFDCLRATAAAAAIWLIPSAASAAPLSVTWGAQGVGGALASASGQELPAGCLVRLGFFDQSLTQVRESAWNVALLDQHFTELARAATGEFGGTLYPISGTFAQSFPADSAHLPAVLANRTVCVWACNSPTLETATEIGIFTSSAWKAAGGQFGGLVWDLSQIEADGLIVGSFSPTQSPTLGGQMNQLASIGVLRDESDADQDGVEALLEQAFGMNPGIPDSALMPEMVALGDGSSRTGYRFRRPTGGTAVNAAIYEAGGFRYTVEVSDNLKAWRVDTAACRVHEISVLGDGFEVVTLRPLVNGVSQPDFYRMKVERQN